jgi:hypothetical protein
MEDEVRHILRDAVKDGIRDVPRGLGSRIAARFSATGLPADLPELRQPLSAARWDE